MLNIEERGNSNRATGEENNRDTYIVIYKGNLGAGAGEGIYTNKLLLLLSPALFLLPEPLVYSSPYSNSFG